MIRLVYRLVDKLKPADPQFRRRAKTVKISSGLENLESRRLLSADVLDADPTAAEVAVDEAKAPPANFAGHFTATSQGFTADLNLTQNGRKLTGTVTVQGFAPVNFKGRVKGNNFSGRAKLNNIDVPDIGTISPKVTFNGTLDNANTFHGSITAKALGQSMTFNYTATRNGSPAASPSEAAEAAAKTSPANFGGFWVASAQGMNVNLALSQNGKSLTGTATLQGFPQLTFKGRVKGDTFNGRGKFTVPVPDVGNVNAKTKFNGTLDNATHFHGTITAKAAGQTVTINYTAVKSA